jgi:hypothetical protein
MSGLSWMRAEPGPRLGRLMIPVWLWLALASGVRAQPAPVVVWLGGDGGNAEARERALRLELDARGLTLLHAAPPAPEAGAAAPPPSRESFARQTLVRSGADAVLWLDSDPSRPVSWLRVVHERSDVTEQAPLPHPPEAIQPELFAIAAASLLEQLLRPTPAVTPEAEPANDAQPAPAGGAALEPSVAVQTPPATPPPAPPSALRARSDDAAPPSDQRWFVQAGLALSLAHVASGMEAATRPSLDEVITELDGRFFFNLGGSWVPDADSFDDFEDEVAGIPRGRTPVPGNCPADGIVTGPTDLEGPDGEPFEQLEPSSYCARVEQPGFAIVPALRLSVGRWLLPRFAASVLYQGHFGIDADTFFGNQLFGAQAEYLALGTRGRGVTLSLLVELTVGRTETPVPSSRDPRDRPINVLSGPLGAQGGALLRVWPDDRFAVFASPTLGARFPAGQLLLDLVAGGELAF